MFKKQFSVKKNNNLRNSDVRKLMARVPEDLVDLLPKKAAVAQVKLQTFNGTLLNAYMIDKEPMFFEFDGESTLFPTVYCTWVACTAFPLLIVYEPVLHRLENGADLMLPGVVRKFQATIKQFERGAAVAIAVITTDGQIMGPMAVGTALMSSQEMVANEFEGRGVQILHIYRDLLWEFGSRVAPPKNEVSVFECRENSEEASANEDFPPLATLSVSNGNTEKVVEEASGHKSDEVPTSLECEVEESMDDLLYRCFLAALKYRVSGLPIDVGEFYSLCLLKCVPDGKRVDMKRTKYKKFSVFLDEVNKGENGPLVKIRKEGKGCDMIEEVFKAHPALHSFVATDENISNESMTATILGPKIMEYFSVTEGVLPLLKTRGNFSKGQLLSGTQIRELITDYVKSEELSQGKTVRLDPILAQVTNTAEETSDWNTILQKVLSKMTKTFVLRLPDGRELIRKISMPKIVFKVESRAGNKKVTLINNLAVFGLDVKKLCHKIQVEAATSATFSNEAVNCEGPQITVLGNQVAYLGELLKNEYGIDKKYIDGLEFAIKKKKK